MKRLQDQSLYEILEVEPGAPAAEVESALTRARALYGPGSLATYTLMSPDEADALTARIEEAGRVLLDATSRAQYDALLASGPLPPSAALPSAAAAVNGESPVVIPAASIARAVIFADDDPPDDEDVEADDAADALENAVESAREAAETELPTVVAIPEPAAPVRIVVEPVAPAARLLAQAAVTGGPADAVAGPTRTPIPLRNAVRAPDAPVPVAVAAPPPVPAPAAEAPALTPAPAPVPAPAPTPALAPAPVIVPEVTAWTGEILRQIREARGLSLQVLAQRTRVTRHHLENIEGDRFTLLPAPVYLRGILMSLARELRLDGQKVAKSYLERAGGQVGPDGGVPIPRR